ncbi:4'-phosphopantetheinyl transferase [Fomes fomentarius]|nr:4'-phosphopantetheinyl transferase [Fomes fomentarius]
MGILGIGVDVLHVPRIIKLMSGPSERRFVHRILSDTEHSVWNSIPSDDHARRTRFLAVRWSVKEATYKAVFPVFRPTWKDLTFHSLSSDGARKPYLEYHPGLHSHNQLMGKIHASVSHDGDYVFTTVIVEAPPSTST